MNIEEWRKMKAENGETGSYWAIDTEPDAWAKESWEKAKKLGLTANVEAVGFLNQIGKNTMQNMFFALDKLGLLNQAEGKE